MISYRYIQNLSKEEIVMTEKILTKNKNGMAMLLILLAVMLMGIIGFIW